MSGKVAGVIAAIAVSSASASIVGVVYTGVVSLRYDPSGVSGLIESFDRAPVEAAVVLDSTKGHLSSLPDLPAESDVPPCRDDGPGRCILVSPSPGFRLSFFGYTVSLPTDWYGADGVDDLYRIGEEQQFFRLFADLGRPEKENVPDNTDQGVSEDNPDYVTNSDVAPVTVPPVTDPAPDIYPIVIDDFTISEPQLNTILKPNASPNGPVYSFVPSSPTSPIGTIPEPSTWTMILAGFAGLGLARLRRANRAATRLMGRAGGDPAAP